MSRSFMKGFPVLASTLRMFALVVFPRIFLSVFSMIFTSGRLSLATGLMKQKSCLLITVSGKPERRVLGW
jgi:hypothetical protein